MPRMGIAQVWRQRGEGGGKLGEDEGAGEPCILESEFLWWHSGEQQKRKIVLDPSGSMNIYLVLDASDSIGIGNFTRAKNCLKGFIEKVEPLPPECEFTAQP